MTGDGLSLQKRVARYRYRHPDAGVAAIAGALGESPADVAEVLNEDAGAEPGETDEPLDDCPTFATDPGVWANNVEDYECWMPWQYVDGRKQPHAVYANAENPMSWSNPDLWRSAEKARMACADQRLEGPGIVLQHEDDPYADWADPFFIVDYDDVRDPETGAVHPVVAEHVEQADSYTDISTSGTGVHIIAKGSLPDDVKTIPGVALPDHDACPGAEVEVYDGKRYVAMTGNHVVGTPTDATDAQEFLDDLVEEFVADEQRRDPSETPRPDTEDWEPEYDEEDLDGLDTTDDIQAVFDACRQVQPRDIRLRSALTEERADGTKSFDPSWETSRSGTRLGWDADIGWIYRKGDVGLDAIQVVALEERITTSPHEYPEGEAWWTAVDALRDRGARIPEYNPPTQTEGATSGGPPGPETCDPPEVDFKTFDREQRWEELQGDRYDAYVDAGGPVIWGDHAGAGKTTNAGRAAAARDREFVALFDKHEKAREFVIDEATPAVDFHLKGGNQKLHDDCMDADHADEQCHEHPGGDCPHMCPIYDLGTDDDARQRYEAVVQELGPVQAHMIFDLPFHDDGSCPWLDQFDELESADRVVGVHEYQLLKTVRDGRDVIVDESPSALKSERTVDIEGIARTATALEAIADLQGTPDTLDEFARFARDVMDALAGDETPDSLADLTPPDVDAATYYQPVDPDDLPDDVAEDDVEQRTIREDVGMPGEGYRTREEYVVERSIAAETFAQAKLAYNETIVSRMRRDEWDGAPLCFDALLAAAAEAGADPAAARQAIAVPTLLENCPWCGEELVDDNGARVCSDDDCDWHEADQRLTQQGGEKARAIARLDVDDGSAAGLDYYALPLTSDLPESPLVLDATATPAKVAALYDVPTDRVVVDGDELLESNLHVTQVLDGQYHAGTIRRALDEDRKLAERIQRTIDTVGDLHQQPLFIGPKALLERFDFPDNGEILYYHAARGLNRSECDAVVCIGAPHPAVDDLQRDAELFGQGTTDVRPGGEEYSTRRETAPPVYRKLIYEDDAGDGRAIATKDFSGLVGELWRETREKELIQAVHRIRPLLADRTKHAYLLTNVPTEMPVDELATFEELADPLEAMLPVPEGAVDLLEAVHDAVDGAGPDGFRADQLVDRRDDGTIANKVDGYHRLAQLTGLDVTRRTVYDWVHALEDVGLLEPEDYEQHAGVSYAVDSATLKSALSVLSSNGGFKVAATRRLRALLRESGSGLDWLAWARDVFDLRGGGIDEGFPLDGGGSGA